MMKGLHYLDKGIFSGYNANGKDVIIPKNITNIHIEALNKVKKMKKIYLHGIDVSFETGRKQSDKDKKFLDTGYPVELHINRYYRKEIPVGDNVTVIADLGTEEDKIRSSGIAKYIMLTGKREFSLEDLINTYTDDDVRDIIDNLIDGECNYLKQYTHYSKVFKAAFSLATVAGDSLSIEVKNRKLFKILKGKMIVLVFDNEIVSYPYCKKYFGRYVSENTPYYFKNDSYFGNMKYNISMKIEGNSKYLDYDSDIIDAEIENTEVIIYYKDGNTEKFGIY